MEMRLQEVEKVLELAMEKSQLSFDRFGLLQLQEEINKGLSTKYKQIGSRYIYDTLYLGIRKAKQDGLSNIHIDQASLDSIVAYLGFGSFNDFRLSFNPVIPPTVLALEGNWYSLVRCNSGAPDLLVSPVQIQIEENIPTMSLYGPHRTYQGAVDWIGGSISSFLRSTDGAKVLHLAFHTGVAKYPKILQGVFSGVASSGIPIAGREILLRTDLLLEEMNNHKLDLLEEPSLDDPLRATAIYKYFADFSQCYFRVDTTSRFDVDDLN